MDATPTAATDGGPDPSSPGTPSLIDACTCYLGCPCLRWFFLFCEFAENMTDWNLDCKALDCHLSTWCWLMIGSVCDSVLVAADSQLLDCEACMQNAAVVHRLVNLYLALTIAKPAVLSLSNGGAQRGRAVHHLKRFMLGCRLNGSTTGTGKQGRGGDWPPSARG